MPRDTATAEPADPRLLALPMCSFHRDHRKGACSPLPAPLPPHGPWCFRTWPPCCGVAPRVACPLLGPVSQAVFPAVTSPGLLALPHLHDKTHIRRFTPFMLILCQFSVSPLGFVVCLFVISCCLLMSIHSECNASLSQVLKALPGTVR